MWRKLLIVFSGAGLLACSSYSYRSYNAQRIGVEKGMDRSATMDSLLAPYSRELAVEMNRVIGEAKVDMQVARPNSVLGQWVTDALLNFGRDSILKPEDLHIPVIVFLNTGGIRASLSKGPVTVGDVFRLMPFDNMLVALKLPATQIPSIEAYLRQTGGEPIAGCHVVNGKLQFNENAVQPTEFWVITSDFLANGGDKMYFFKEATDKRLSNALMRDVLMHTITKERVLDVKEEERITF